MGMFRAIRGKKANMSYMFKNDKRRHAFTAPNTLLGIIWKLALAAFIICAALFGGALGLWLLVLVLFFWLKLARDTWMPNLMNFAGKMILVGLIATCVFLAVYVIKFIFEWLMILTETRELKKDPAGNKNYLDVSRAVKAVKLANLIVFIVFAAIFIGIGIFVKNNKDALGDIDQKIPVILGVALIVLLVASKIFSVIQFKKVQPQIAQIKTGRAETKQELKAAKRNGSNIAAAPVKCPNCGANTAGAFCEYCGAKTSKQ